MQAINTNCMEITWLVGELWHFKDNWPKLEWENQTFSILFCGCCCLGNFSLDLPLPSPMAMDCCTNGQGTPQTWTWFKTTAGLFQFYFFPCFIPSHPVPFHSDSYSDSNHFLKCHSSQTSWPIFMPLVAIACIFRALYDTCKEIKNRSRKSWAMACRSTITFYLHHTVFTLPPPPFCRQDL